MAMRVVMTVAAGLFLGLAGQAQTMIPVPASLRGTVLGEDGKPLVGATVYAYSDLRTQVRTSTNAEGEFVLTPAPVGVVYIDAFKESDGYSYNFFGFNKAIGEEIHKLYVGPDAQIQDVVIKLGPRAATLHLDITGTGGTAVTASAALMFTREDNGRPEGEAVNPGQTVLVPSLVPFHFTVSVAGYKPWKSESITGQPGETLDVTVRLRRQ